MKNSLSSYVRNTAFRPAGLSRGSSSSEAFWNAPFSLSNSSIFSPVNCWNTRGFVLASSYFISFPPLPSFYSLLHAFPIDSRIGGGPGPVNPPAGCVLRFAKAIQPLGGPKWPFFAAFQRHAGDQAAVPTAKRTRPYAFPRRTVLLLLSHRRV